MEKLSIMLEQNPAWRKALDYETPEQLEPKLVARDQSTPRMANHWFGRQPPHGHGAIEMKLQHINNMNCYDAHVREMVSGDELRYGWAVGPFDVRSQHCWIVRDGQQIDQE